MNRKQRIALLGASFLTAMMVIFPPHTLEGSFVGYGLIAAPHVVTTLVRDTDAEIEREMALLLKEEAEEERNWKPGLIIDTKELWRASNDKLRQDEAAARAAATDDPIFREVLATADGFDLLRLALQMAALGLAAAGLVITFGGPDRAAKEHGADEDSGSGIVLLLVFIMLAP